jgi:GT2 family glycosyltransferase
MEDIDFSLRAIQKGFEPLYLPTAEASHKIGDIMNNRTNSFVMYHRGRSRTIFLRKQLSGIYSVYAIIITVLIYTPYRLFQVAHGSREVAAMIAWIRGVKDGLLAQLSPPQKPN